MTFRWKKKKSRFSKLVADHLQSPKHGGSLVVETGFPTSLIDLYVRNRGRFRRFSEKKRRGDDSLTSLSSDSSMNSSNLSSVASGYTVSNEIFEEDAICNVNVDVNSVSTIEEERGVEIGNSSEIREDLGVEITNSCKIVEERGVERANLSRIEEERGVEFENLSRIEEERGVERSNSSEFEEDMSVEMAKSNWVLVAVLKVLFVVVLALGTERFTVGITVSAFLLFFLELVGKPLMSRLSLISSSYNPKKLFKSHFHETKNIESSKANLSLVCNEVLEVKEVDSKEEIVSEKESDEVRCEVLLEVNYKSSRRAKMKSKMKKLVPKKLRTSRKSFLDSKGEIPRGFKEEDSVELDQDRKPQSHSLVISNECSSSKGEAKQEQDKVVEVKGLSLPSEMDGNDKELGREMQTNSEYLVLCLIVLVGLVVGRILALVLALSWCLMLKKTQRRTVKVFVP